MISGHRETEQGIRALTFQAESILDAEFVRALHICDATLALEGALTFQPATSLARADWKIAWQAWLDGPFAGIIAPALLAASRLAQAGQFREIAVLDQGVTDGIADESTTLRSRAAGRKMLLRLSGAKGVRWLDRLHRAAEAGQPRAISPLFTVVRRRFSTSTLA